MEFSPRNEKEEAIMDMYMSSIRNLILAKGLQRTLESILEDQYYNPKAHPSTRMNTGVKGILLGNLEP